MTTRGVAVAARGYDRATYDVDLVVWKIDERLEPVLASLSENGLTTRDVYGIAGIRSRRVILLVSPGGTNVDVSLGILPFERELIERADRLPITDDVVVPVATAEDVIILKLIAGRTRDRADICRLVELYPNIDRECICTTIAEFFEAMDEPDRIPEALDLLT